MPRAVRVVGDAGVGKASFVRALGALPNAAGVRILRDRAQAAAAAAADDDADALVLVFDLRRRESLAAAIAQWGFLVDTAQRPAGRFLLLGTHADCTAEREVLAAEAQELAATEFHAYEELCCVAAGLESDALARVRRLLAQWTAGDVQSASVRASEELQPERASICTETPASRVLAPVLTSQSLPGSPAAGARKPCARASVWLYDPTEDAPAGVASGADAGDVKLRAISRAMYDMRVAGAEKSKAVAKYREREMHQWLLRSRYFGPTESSRHKRWQEDQKKRQQLTHTHTQSRRRSRQQASVLQPPELEQGQRSRSVSHPGQRQPVGSNASSSESESEEAPATPLARKSFMQPTELHVQRQQQRQLETDAQQRKKRAAKRAMRKQRRAVSNDLYERRSVAVGVDAWVQCCDATELPPAWRLETTCASAPLDVELRSPGAERVACLPTPLPTTHLQSPMPPVASPVASSAPSYSSQSDSESGAARADASAGAKEGGKPCRAAPAETGGADTVCSSSSEDLDCHDIDDMLEYFENVTLPI